MKNDPVQDYILESQSNLNTACVVAAAWIEVRAKIATTFINRLEARLKTQLKGWEYGREKTVYVDMYAYYNFWKPEWSDNYGLRLQWGRYGEEMVFGVYRVREKIDDREFSKELLAAVAAIQPSAHKNLWYEARILMKDPASDWSTSDALWRMRQDDEFLAQVADQLFKIVNVSEGIIDGLVRKG